MDKEGPIGPGHGVMVEDCAFVSRYIEQIFDADSSIPETYILEVSSPGVERKIRKSEQLGYLIGYDVQLTLNEPLDGESVIVARLDAVDGEEMELTYKEETMKLLWSAVKRAKLKYDFGNESSSKKG